MQGCMQVVGRRGLKRKAVWVAAKSDSSGSMGQVVLWFKNDLRLHDNYVVDRAQQLVKSGKAKEVRISTERIAYNLAKVLEAQSSQECDTTCRAVCALSLWAIKYYLPMYFMLASSRLYSAMQYIHML